jgi:hypothetical protein
MDRIAEKLVELFRPWYRNGLPEDLQFGEIELWNFTRDYMHRMARLSVANGFPFGVFDMIGQEYARRAARAWWPIERLMMEDISFAMKPIEKRVWESRPVPQILVDRLVFLLDRYLSYVGPAWADEEIREAVAEYIREEVARQKARDEPADAGSPDS